MRDYLEKYTSDLYLEKPSDVQRYSAMYAHLQAQALSPGHTRHFITDTIQLHSVSPGGTSRAAPAVSLVDPRRRAGRRVHDPPPQQAR
ncbi:Scr1 family TA system antitoxin-like transcriptional regulator [Streptomyces chryseus]|uniref:Scr1 family TA system antitoxin-like transcriptional regulator n=1 Tax=Streptomyces chryseus TaxID=68186 RepID=UPI003137BD46